MLISQPCQNVQAASNFAVYRQSFATYFILEFQRNLLADSKTQSLLSNSSAMLPATTKHFDRADLKPSDRLTEQTPSDSTMRLLSVYSRRQAPFKVA